MSKQPKGLTVDLARTHDLEQIMNVELAAYGDTMSASRECMLARIKRCNHNASSLYEGFMWVIRNNSKIIAFMVMQPLALTPDACTSWEHATDNGTLEHTWSDDGPNLYVVEIAAYPEAYALGAVDLVVLTATTRFARWHQTHPGSCCMFMSRMPGLDHSCKTLNITPSEYYSHRRHDGSHRDPLVRELVDLTGHDPNRLVENGYSPDDASRKYGALFVITDPWRAIEFAKRRTCRSVFMAGAFNERDRKIARITIPDAEPLFGGDRIVWDRKEIRYVSAGTIYLPQGCSYGKCPFCGFWKALADYRAVCFSGQPVPDNTQIEMFEAVLVHAKQAIPGLHTLYVFNGGSFLGHECPVTVREAVIDLIAHSGVAHVVIESLPKYITEDVVQPMMETLRKGGVRATIRIGVETGNDILRNKHLKKGISRRQIRHARKITRDNGIALGAYLMLAPAPDTMLRDAMEMSDADFDTIDAWCVAETVGSAEELLAPTPHGFGLDEVYLGATCVAGDTPLSEHYARGEFRVPTLHMISAVLQALDRKGLLPQVELLRQEDEPPFLAVPSLSGTGTKQGYLETDPHTARCAELLERYRTNGVPVILHKLIETLSRDR